PVQAHRAGDRHRTRPRERHRNLAALCRQYRRERRHAPVRTRQPRAQERRVSLMPNMYLRSNEVTDHPTRATARMMLLVSCALFASGCSSLERWKLIGEQPPLSSIDNPTTQPGYKPVQMPMPAPQPATYNPNSLWRNGSRAFFKDQRAHQIGDILTVSVRITDKAQMENETQRSRVNKEDSGVTDYIGSKTLGASAAKAILPRRILTPDPPPPTHA